jgi:hypothetical protein
LSRAGSLSWRKAVEFGTAVADAPELNPVEYIWAYLEAACSAQCVPEALLEPGRDGKANNEENAARAPAHHYKYRTETKQANRESGERFQISDPDTIKIDSRVADENGFPTLMPTTLDEMVATALSQHRFNMLLFLALAMLAFLLAALGIYSVMTYNVRSRIPEISIRMALGAQVGDVLRLGLTDGMRPALAGLGVGGVAALYLTGLLSKMITASDQPTRLL